MSAILRISKLYRFSLAFFLLIPIAGQAALNLSVTYDVDVSIDTKRDTKAASVAKALADKLPQGGAVSFGSLKDTVSIGRTSYRINSTGQAAQLFKPFLPGDEISRRSDGAVIDGRLSSQRFSETRGTRPTVRVEFDYGKKVATYYKGKATTKQEPLLYSTVDVASLPYLFVKQPLPQAPLTVAVTDGKSIRNFVLQPKDDSVRIGQQEIPALKLTRRLDNRKDAAVELWVRKSDGVPLRLRVDLNAEYGVVVNQQVREIPAPLN